MSRRLTRAAALQAGAGLACAGLVTLAGCGSGPATATGAGPPPLTAPLATLKARRAGPVRLVRLGAP